ncbi:MAG: ATP-binding protein, partial [Acidobacteria bacterium]|nr:ATP-binding protein [Acidobacteriota bacterium]
MKIRVQNFRSIQSQEIEIAPITLLYGPNASGKSGLLYALLTLRNIVLAPNQSVPGFFNFQVMSLGGFREVVFNHDIQSEIRLAICLEKEGVEKIEYGVELRENQGRFFINWSVPWQSGRWDLPVAFPYPGNQQTNLEILMEDGQTLTFSWTGLTCTMAPRIPSPPGAEDLARRLNAPVETLRKGAFVPHRRGFFQPQYS